MTETRFATIEEDVERAAEAMDPGGWANGWAVHREMLRDSARRTLATIGPIVERERRAAKVEALREFAKSQTDAAETLMKSATVHRDLARDHEHGSEGWEMHSDTAWAFRKEADGAWAAVHRARELANQIEDLARIDR